MTLPSGAITGDEVELSFMRPEPRVLVSGSTPVVVPTLQPPGVPLAGSVTLQPSLKRLRVDAAHFGVRSGLSATMYPKRETTWFLATRTTVPSDPIAGAALMAGRTVPHGNVGAAASGAGGNASPLSGNPTSHGTFLPVAPGTRSVNCSMRVVPSGVIFTNHELTGSLNTGSLMRSLSAV